MKRGDFREQVIWKKKKGLQGTRDLKKGREGISGNKGSDKRKRGDYREQGI